MAHLLDKAPRRRKKPRRSPMDLMRSTSWMMRIILPALAAEVAAEVAAGAICRSTHRLMSMTDLLKMGQAT